MEIYINENVFFIMLWITLIGFFFFVWVIIYTKMDNLAKIKKELTAHQLILELMTKEELRDLKERVSRGLIELFDSTILDILDKLIQKAEREEL